MQMKSNLWNYYLAMFNLLMQSTEAHLLNVGRHIMSLRTVFSKDIWRICGKIAELVDALPWNVSWSGERLSLQQAWSRTYMMIRKE